MSAAARIGLFAALLAVGFGGAYLLGSALDPDSGPSEDGHSAGGERVAAAQERHADAAHGSAGEADVRGHGSLRLVVDRGEFDPGRRGVLVFRVVDDSGATVDDYDVVHERAMHTLAVREDLTGYRHVHPRRRADGAWEVAITFSDAGPHRLYADFSTGGQAHTLSAAVRVEGDYAPRALPAARRVADAGDGYAVAMRRDGSQRVFTVTRDGRPVSEIEPYLGARGHLVAVRAGDLAFQHVHPRDAATAGRAISFDVALDGGPHRLFLQFKHDGRVRTAAFTETGAAASDRGADEGADGHGGHGSGGATQADTHGDDGHGH